MDLGFGETMQLPRWVSSKKNKRWLDRRIFEGLNLRYRGKMRKHKQETEKGSAVSEKKS